MASTKRGLLNLLGEVATTVVVIVGAECFAVFGSRPAEIPSWGVFVCVLVGTLIYKNIKRDYDIPGGKING